MPAAHTVFMCEKVTMPSRRVVNFASWPPISMIVSIAGSSAYAARACAVISSTTRSARTMEPTNFLPGPRCAHAEEAQRAARPRLPVLDGLADGLDRGERRAEGTGVESRRGLAVRADTNGLCRR